MSERPLFISDFLFGEKSLLDPIWILQELDASPHWINRDGAPRDEIFMSMNTQLTYSYGKSAAIRHTYTAVPMHAIVTGVCAHLNRKYGTKYNVCVLNRYVDQ